MLAVLVDMAQLAEEESSLTAVVGTALSLGS